MGHKHTPSLHNQAEHQDSESLTRIRVRLLRWIITASAIASIGVMVLFRATNQYTGHRIVLFCHAVCAIIVWAVVLSRRRLSVAFQTGVVLATLFSVGFSDVLQFGPLSTGALTLSLACVLTSVFFDMRAGLAALGAVTALMLIGMLAEQSGALSFRAATFASTTSRWSLALSSLVSQTAMTIVTMGILQGALYRLLKTSDVRKMELELANRAMAETEARYRALAENSPVGIYMLRNRRVAYANPSLSRLVGFAEDEIIGRHVIDFIAPECREEVERTYEEPINPTRVSSRLICRDGRTLDVEVYDMDILTEGEPGSIGTVIDVTERLASEQALRDSEERYRTVVQTSSDAITVLDPNGRIITANRAACEDRGWHLEDMMGNSMLQYIAPEDHERARAALERVLHEGTIVFEGTAVAADGSTWPFEAHSSLMLDRSGKAAGVVSVLRDLTERRRVEEEKRQFYRETISTVTDGRLQVVGTAEIEPYLQSAEVRMTVDGHDGANLARVAIEDYCREKGLPDDALSLLMTGFGEALTNALKHAGSAELIAGTRHDAVWAGVRDKGTGIATLSLPKATLQMGYSTKKSLGMGYSIMLDVSDQVLLCTDTEGTTVILTKSLHSGPRIPSDEDQNDIWDSI